MKPKTTLSKKPRAYQKHGLTAMKSAIKGLGGRVIDRRTALGKALDTWARHFVFNLNF